MSDSEFKQIERKPGPHAVREPTVSINGGNGNTNILSTAFEEMGEPEYIEVYYTDDGRLGFLPRDVSTAPSYTINSQQGNNSFSCRGLAECTQFDGLERLVVEENDDGLWVADVSEAGEQ